FGMFYYLRVIWAMYFVAPPPPSELADAFIRVSPPEPAPTTNLITSNSGTVAVAEPQAAPAVVARPASTRAPTTAAHPTLTLGTWLALTLAALLTLGLGILPGRSLSWHARRPAHCSDNQREFERGVGAIESVLFRHLAPAQLTPTSFAGHNACGA